MTKNNKTDNKVTTDNHAKQQMETEPDTWKTELATELQQIVDSLNEQNPDHKTVAGHLRQLHMEFYADKLDNLGYHYAAKEDNVGKPDANPYEDDQPQVDTTEADNAIQSGHADQATDQAPTSDSTATVRPASDPHGMATTESTKPIAKKK